WWQSLGHRSPGVFRRKSQLTESTLCRKVHADRRRCMALSRSWRVWILLPLGLFVVAIAGSWLLLSFMVEPLHSDAKAIPSVTQMERRPQWSAAVENARLAIRSGMAEQNLTGLSVAVGAGGNVVWSEGFGWAEMETLAPVTPDTRFRIGSASTVLSSAAAGLL